MSKLLIAALAGILTVFVFENGGIVEGRVAPVMGPLEISPERQIDGGYTVVSGEAAKYRNCEFIALIWYLGPRNGRRVEVEVYFLDAPRIRMPGQLQWDGIAVHLTRDQVLHNSHADVIHQCGPRPWRTRTPFYTSQPRSGDLPPEGATTRLAP